MEDQSDGKVADGVVVDVGAGLFGVMLWAACVVGMREGFLYPCAADCSTRAGRRREEKTPIWQTLLAR